MPLWDGAVAILLERSSAGQTATVLGGGDAVFARCDDAGAVTDAAGTVRLWAALSWPYGSQSPARNARLDVWGPDRAWVGLLSVRRYTFTPFSKRLTLAMVDTSGAQVGELAPADKKGRALTITAGGAEAASLALEDRDRSVRQTVERWSLSAGARPHGAAELLAAAAVLRYGKLLAEIGVHDRRRTRA